METILAVLSWVVIVGLILGLIKPSWALRTGEKTRVRVLKVYGLSYLALVVAFVIFGSGDGVRSKEGSLSASSTNKSGFEYSNWTLKEFRNESKSDRHDVIDEYVDYMELPDSVGEGFYSCISQMTYTKSPSLTLGEVLGWCKTDYDRDSNALDGRLNFDNFESAFTSWDGSHRELERVIKNSMHDDDSYDHVETSYRLILNESPRAVVTTTFRGANAFGGIVKQTVSANVDIETGKVISIIQ